MIEGPRPWCEPERFPHTGDMVPWLSAFRTALTQNRRQRYVQVATASRATGPTVRTVVLRRLEDDGTLIFFTDTRSEKIAQLKEDDRMELHTWWTKGRVQFRLRGRARVSVEPSDARRKELWRELQEDDLVRFLGAAPGTARNGTPPASELLAIEGGVADTFALIRMTPEQVDVLRLHPEAHVRTRYRREGEGWAVLDVEP